MGRLDFFLIAGNYTLLNHSALDSLLPLCERKGMSVTVGAPFASALAVREQRPEPSQPLLIVRYELQLRLALAPLPLLRNPLPLLSCCC